MLALKAILLALTGVTQEIIVGVFIFVIFNLKIEWKKVFSYAIVMGLTSSISSTFFPQAGSMINMAIFAVATMFLLIFMLKFNILKSIAVMCLVYFYKAIVSLIALPVLKLLYIKIDATNPTLQQHLIAQAIGIIVLFLILMIIMYFKIKIYIPEDLNRKSTISIVINIVLSVLLLFPNLFYMEEVISSRSPPIFIYNTVSFLLIVLFNIFNFIRLGKLEVLRQNMEFQELYIKTLNEMVDSLRGFKHDHNNMLQVIGGYISVNDMDGLNKFYNQMVHESKKINNFIPLNSYIKDNPAIYGLLLSKISYAEVKNINFTINVLFKIEIGNIKIYDLCKILGVLLDNAIEAAEVSDKKYVELSIRENSDKKCLIIEINNSCNENIDLESIFKDGYTTKKDHTGFGLWETQKIVNGYKNCKLHTSLKYNEFSQKIEISYL